ncbi:MAG: LysR family transcriptional regulator [Pseudomonas sp.]|uniref:LysR family transcriptional regulator n=1 Tax=unclassified Pseudomonas TaxID=196821 RepID=UPI0007313011|nr:LysR family transcriptional regulator [Pseudomonas sp. L5B5]KTC36905.1 LysR family transcriptional regulator [Pseudomonas sp. ABAC61]UCZ86849.1 LysR family transcriptional regulator [Pseudomonas sp. L5B5]
MTRIPDANVIQSRLRLRQLRLMLALQEFGSLRRAADHIGMTQPAATKMLHEAEDLLGVELFERLSRGMRPTPFGETVIYYARMVFAELSGMREELVSLESGNLGRVTVGAIPALASGLLTRTIATLKQSHPRLSMSIQVDTSDVLVQALLQEQLDVVLGRIPAGARAEELLFDSLGEEALCVIAGARNPLAQATQLDWAKLQDQTWVLQQHPSPMRSIVNQVFHNARVDIPSSIVETTSIMTLLSLVQQTDMIGVTPVSVVEDYPGRHLLAVLPIQFEARLPPFGLITRRQRIQSSAMQAFMDAVRQEHMLIRN